MARFEIVMPKLGESIIEATITKWLKQVGEEIAEDDSIVEIATDKVDSEIPSPVEGKLIEQLYQEGEIVAVGKVIAVIEIEGEEQVDISPSDKTPEAPAVDQDVTPEPAELVPAEPEKADEETAGEVSRFLSPLVKNIARAEGLSHAELNAISGSGKEGRLTKRDLLEHLEKRITEPQASPVAPKSASAPQGQRPAVQLAGGDQLIEMDRMRRLIADHMVMSKQVSPHVTSFIEADMTRIVQWREANKASFEQREGEKLTYTPIIFEAAAKALKDFPGVNASVDGHNIIIRKRINIGMATLLPNGNLIVPVIHDADQKNLAGMAKAVNNLAERARNNQLQPDDIQGGTFTITNLGSFGSITGTPIINQPQVAILAIGAIRKMPAVIETPEGDMIAIRHKMILALTYDHRVVDGGMGGLYLKRVVELLEKF
jgi:2-oxoglutarate dehydrogenase E2 component (dihydrolipoamide succinyltransferase)